MKTWFYGVNGRGKDFWKRLFCKHDWNDVDAAGYQQTCVKCGKNRWIKSW